MFVQTSPQDPCREGPVVQSFTCEYMQRNTLATAETARQDEFGLA